MESSEPTLSQNGKNIKWSSFLMDFFSPSLFAFSFMCSLYETEKDGTEWLYPEAFHKLLCMQAVSLFDANL